MSSPKYVRKEKHITPGSIIIKKGNYSWEYTAYITNHWLRSWWGYSFKYNGVASDDEKVLNAFIREYYGILWEVQTKDSHPQEYV